MLRRPISEEPISRLAAWSNRLAWFALVLAALSVIVLRGDFLEIVPALATFGAALVLAGLAILCSFGAMQITDRAKDVIKSGGEWISSIELENLAVGHPKVAEAAVIGIAHPKWDERPLLVVILKKGETATKDELLGFMQGKIAKWWMPDDVVFVDEIPHTATGKILKTALRDQFKDYRLPTAEAAE